MKLAGRIPIEPLDDERLTNLERRVVAGAIDAAARGERLHARRRQVGRVLAVVALGVAVFAGWALRGAPAERAIPEQAAIDVRSDGERTILDIGDARIASDPATSFAVTRPDGGVLVALSRGTVDLAVVKRAGRPPLVVRAGETDVVVVGTQFSVEYDGSERVDVRVREGEVRVVHHRQETRVAAGQAWLTERGLIASAERDASPAARGTSARAPAPVESGANAPGSAAGSAAGIKAAAAPSRVASVAGRPRASAQPSNPLLDLRTAIRAQRVEPALDLGEPDPLRAIASYYRIAARRSGDEASRAFYSIAVVYHFKLARDADALEVLDGYARRFAVGSEYRAALWLRVRIQCLARIDDRCRAAAHTYLHDAPDGPAVEIAERLTHAE